jgi:CrcB protein
MALILQIALGGAMGAVGRYGLGLGATRLMGAGFPFGTLIINILGSFAMGVAFVLLMEKGDSRYAPFFMTGLLGGFTTFSAFSLDVLKMVEQNHLPQAALYVCASVLVTICAVFVGVWLTRGLGA